MTTRIARSRIPDIRDSRQPANLAYRASSPRLNGGTSQQIRAVHHSGEPPKSGKVGLFADKAYSRVTTRDHDFYPGREGESWAAKQISSVTNKSWTRLSNGEYVLKSSEKCLTGPSTTNGRQLTVAACKNTANQHWSLP